MILESNLSSLEFLLAIVKRDSIDWNHLANGVLPNTEGNRRAYNTLLKYPEFVDAIYESGRLIF